MARNTGPAAIIRKQHYHTLVCVSFMFLGVTVQPTRLSSIFYSGRVRGFLLVFCFHDNSWVGVNLAFSSIGLHLTNAMEKTQTKKEILHH